MRTRRSPRNQDRLYKAIGADLQRAAADAALVDYHDGETLYSAVKRLGIEHDSHESDLYLPVTPQVQALLRLYKLRATVFTHTTKHVAWYDVPFMYAPFWEQRQRRLHVCPDGPSCPDPTCQAIRRGLGDWAT